MANNTAYSEREAEPSVHSLTLGRHQHERIETDSQLRLFLAKLAPLMFEESPHGGRRLVGSRYAITASGPREFLFGRHVFDGGESVETIHEVHISDVGEVGAPATLQKRAVGRYVLLLESYDTTQFDDVVLLGEGPIEMIERMMAADERDLYEQSLAKWN